MRVIARSVCNTFFERLSRFFQFSNHQVEKKLSIRRLRLKSQSLRAVLSCLAPRFEKFNQFM